MKRSGKHKATRDHLWPRSRGGELVNGNRVICCQRCNLDKKDYSLHEWQYRLVKGSDSRALLVAKVIDLFDYDLNRFGCPYIRKIGTEDFIIG